MKISTKLRYGLRALAYLTKKGKICSVQEVSVREKIPFNYLGKIFLKLKEAGLVKVKKGKYGGYYLGKKPQNISLGQIFRALGEPTAPVLCLGLKAKYFCPHKNKCAAKNIWIKIKRSWDQTLDSLTLNEVNK